ncbi:pantoate--beta-alanine ligase [Paenibacillus motobuensis]|uniref:pantoate--beta-alanine ligase n=1 Tax=Paenibacillus TaxID=44249 RepID=UPI0020425322|nr:MULTISPECIES: pantoate--beta-alanine ligase [Paenibacillus]MCM3040112.1 pantoate--beta-alanine ligase [Paenibacillus lutimineralis]MCM3647216.1 pantoate--beta-alanine ligase [Paenibacillus motobuensis]
MKVFTAISELKELLKSGRIAAIREGRELQVGLVPTMGYLHEGHASLLRRARTENDLVVLSIFVNPIQFGPNEDLDRYPRDAERDLALAEREGVDAVFMPSVEVMYPQPTKTKIAVAELTSKLCGATRPGHFDGVTTVVSKLFNIVAPNRAYFGQKDAQQVAVVAQMVKDLNFDIEIVPCPIVRENDGLALSSRNVYLSVEEHESALILSHSLKQLESDVYSGQAITAMEARQQLMQKIGSEPLAEIDYVEIAAFPDLTALQETNSLSSELKAHGAILVAVAVKFGTTRLIDNVLLTGKGEAIHV